jgi:hypothetical protein
MVFKIQDVFNASYKDYLSRFQPSAEQENAAFSIMACKSGTLGQNISICDECEHLDIHNNSCRNRHCPCCQALLREKWVESRKAEVINAPYFHLVFTVPKELNPLIHASQKLLYGLLHLASSETILALSKNKKNFGATPGIIQVLHTWGQELNYHPHIHVIIAGGGLSEEGRFVKAATKFFLPVKLLGRVFRAKFLEKLKAYFADGSLAVPASLDKLRNSYWFKEFIYNLYAKDFIPYIKETFNGFGNAIEYLGRYSHRIAISNKRIISVTDAGVSFWAKDYRLNTNKVVALTHTEFIRRFLMHVLPKGFQKIRYFGFLNNRFKMDNLKKISRLTGKELFKSIYAGLGVAELMLSLYGTDIRLCPECETGRLLHSGRTFRKRE